MQMQTAERSELQSADVFWSVRWSPGNSVSCVVPLRHPAHDPSRQGHVPFPFLPSRSANYFTPCYIRKGWFSLISMPFRVPKSVVNVNTKSVNRIRFLNHYFFIAANFINIVTVGKMNR